MSRFAFALLLAALTAVIVSHIEPPLASAQDKKKDKKKGTPEPAGDIKDDLSRVLPVFDTGSHTQPISAMGFTKDKSKLVTVGQDFTVQVWNSATGERLDILRLPGYGREKGYDPGRWEVAAVSPDGTRVAIGGQMKYLSAGGDDNTARLLLVDVVNRSVVRVQLRTGRNRPVTALAFSPDGDRLAVGIDAGPKENAILMVVGDLANRIKRARPGVETQDCSQISLSVTPSDFAFAPDGARLAVGSRTGTKLSLWELPAGVAPTPKLTKELALDASTMGIGWSPDGKQFVHSVRDNNEAGRGRGFDIRSADGALVKSLRDEELFPVLQKNRFVTIHALQYLNATTVYFVATGRVGPTTVGTIAGTLELEKSKARQVGTEVDGVGTVPVGAATGDGKRIAYTVSGNTEVLIGAPEGGATVRCGLKSPFPTFLGWSKDPAKPGFAWTEEREISRTQPRDPETMKFGFDLTKVEPLGAIRGANYETALWKHGEWSFKSVPDEKKAPADGFPRGMRLMKGDKAVANFPVGAAGAHTLIPNDTDPPLVAIRAHTNPGLERCLVYNADGKVIVRLLPDAPGRTDMASSPDGRYLATTTGSPRIAVYRMDGTPFAMFSFAQLNGEWVLWTPEGYYAASPGGEKMFGWAINNGPNELVTFYPAEKFAKQFRRPDVIKLAIEKGSVKEALVSLSTVAPELEKILPPSAKLELVELRGATAKVKATASSGAKDKPVTAMRVLLDGRPLPAGKGVWTPVAGKPAEEVFEIEVPPGLHELKALVRNEDGSTVSDPLPVRGPKTAGSQPTIYRVCVGVNEYDDAGLKLGSAAKDAADMFAALEKYCVGNDNRFGSAKGELVLNKDATRDRVLKALADARKSAKPGDLLVVFFAGHGVKQGDSYYLLTREADPSKDLKGKSLSGDDLRKGLSEVECPVLLLLDACHSAASVKTFRPATDDLTRSLTDDTVGVTVMSAAMSHETAGATAENGFFTAGLLKGLQAGEGVPFDPYERQLYVHHLYSVAFSEVRKATNGKQNPFLNLPWTVPPMPVREISVK